MFQNYAKIAFRNLFKQRGYAFINIAGLAVGIVSCILIFLYIADELRFDRQFSASDRTYRLIDYIKSDGEPYAAVPPKWGKMAAQQFPEIANMVRIRKMDLFTPLITHGEKRFYEDSIWFVDSTFFAVFDFEVAAGDRQSPLQAPNSIVLSESAARKYFGEQEAVGKSLTYNQQEQLLVTAVVKVPKNTHLQFSMVRRFPPEPSGWWVRTYLLLKENTAPAPLAAKIGMYLQENYREDDAVSFQFSPKLQPVTDIHLHSNAQWELGPNGNIAALYLLGAIAILILLVACINFMNLATARAIHRGREVGMRKVLGAHRRQLAAQFLGESILMAIFAFILALGLLEFLLPYFEAFTNKHISDLYRSYVFSTGGIFSIILFVGLLSGSYPALFLSSFKPINILKGAAGSRSPRLRKALVVSQFAISMILLIGTGVIFDQLEYVKNKRLGFNKDKLLVITSRDREVNTSYESIKASLLQHSDIVNISFSQAVPGRRVTSFRYTMPGNEPLEFGMTAFATDHDFIKTMGIEMKAGRDFSADFGTDHEAFILNQAAVAALGWENPVGREIGVTYFNKMGRVVGVVEDFHFNSLHQSVDPAVIQVMPPGFFSKIIVRVRGENLTGAINFLERKWNEFAPDYPFDFYFVDQDLENLYRGDEALGEIFAGFAILAITIACLGLFGLAAFAAEQRTREIGVRKVLGASVMNVFTLLSKEFVKLTLLANLIAWPLAWLVMNTWLQEFAYRTDISGWIFLLSGITVLAIALCTVSYQAIRAALINPVESLRHE